MGLLDIGLECMADDFLSDFNQEDNEPMLLELAKLLHRVRREALLDAAELCKFEARSSSGFAYDDPRDQSDYGMGCYDCIRSLEKAASENT